MIGVSCTAFSSSDPNETLDSIVGDFELWEIFSECRHSICDRRDQFADLLPSYDISYSVHTPISDINIASLNERIRMISLDEVVETCKVASELGISVLTVHPGLEPMAVKGLTQPCIQKAKESMKVLDRIASEYSLDIGIENMPSLPFFLGRTAESLAEIIEGTDLGVTFDIGHANTTGEIDSMIRMFGDRIVNIHIHDNRGDADSHMTLGEGNIDFGSVIPSLEGYCRNYVIESKSLESAQQSQDILHSLLS